jgi:hypothetical protein
MQPWRVLALKPDPLMIQSTRDLKPWTAYQQYVGKKSTLQGDIE